MKKDTVLGLIIFLAIWLGVTSLGLIPKIFLASPIDVFGTLIDELCSGIILRDALYTIVRLIVGFALGTVIGIPLGILMGYSERIYNLSEVMVDFFRSLPAVALFPLFLVIFGIGEEAKIAIAAWSSALVIIINTMYGVKNSKKVRLMVARTMRATKLQMFSKIVLPDATPDIVAGLRVSLSLSLIVVVVAEFFTGTTAGLGLRIYNAGMIYRIPEMYAAIFLVGMLGYGMNKIFVLIEKRFVHWRGR
jgi:NitT/TauT family transport system permease protein